MIKKITEIQWLSTEIKNNNLKLFMCFIPKFSKYSNKIKNTQNYEKRIAVKEITRENRPNVLFVGLIQQMRLEYT